MKKAQKRLSKDGYIREITDILNESGAVAHTEGLFLQASKTPEVYSMISWSVFTKQTLMAIYQEILKDADSAIAIGRKILRDDTGKTTEATVCILRYPDSALQIGINPETASPVNSPEKSVGRASVGRGKES